MDTLQNKLMTYVAYNFVLFEPSQLEYVRYLPNSVKNTILHKVLCVRIYSKRNIALFKLLFDGLVNNHTEELDLFNVSVDLDILASLRRCSNLKQLRITKIGDDCTDEDLQNCFAHFKHLNLLVFKDSTRITLNLVQIIVKTSPQLKALDVRRSPSFDDNCLVAVSNLTNLQWITVSKTTISNNGVIALVQGPSGPKLREVAISDCPNVEDPAIIHTILENCLSLEDFSSAFPVPLDSDVQNSCSTGCQCAIVARQLRNINWTVSW